MRFTRGSYHYPIYNRQIPAQGYQNRGRCCECFPTCLDTRQPGTVFKKLGTRQSEILTNFLEIARLIPLKTKDICLEMSSDYKYFLGLKVEATVELGHRVKSQCFRHLENIQVLTH